MSAKQCSKYIPAVVLTPFRVLVKLIGISLWLEN